MPYIFSKDDEEGIYKTHRFTLKCKTSDLKYVPLLKAICHHDLGLKPSIFHRVYFINIHRKTIFHVYDDRGCDVLVTTPDTIRAVYHQYNGWILDYDRPKIDKVLNKEGAYRNFYSHLNLFTLKSFLKKNIQAL